MGISGGPDIIQDGLVLSLDASDRNSYVGLPNGIELNTINTLTASLDGVGIRIYRDATQSTGSGTLASAISESYYRVIWNVTASRGGSVGATFRINNSSGNISPVTSLLNSGSYTQIIKALATGPLIINPDNNGCDFDLDYVSVQKFNSDPTIWFDLSENNLTGSLINTPTYSSSNSGNFIFNGINSYIKVPSNPSLQPSTTLTVECAFKRNSGRTFLTYSADGSGASKIYSFECTPNLLAKVTTTTQQYILTANINTDTWYYAALTYNGSLFSLYINGSLSTSTAASGTITYEASANLNLGRKNETDGEYMSGSIGLTRIYNRALSATEVRQNYNATKTRFGIYT